MESFPYRVSHCGWAVSQHTLKLSADTKPLPLAGRHINAVVKWALMQLHQHVSSSAIIAGGYLRDLWHGVEPKDIDIFISDVKEDILKDRLETCLRRHWPSSECLNPCDSAITQHMYEQHGIREQWIFRGSCLPPINLLIDHDCRSLQDQIGRFDFGICMIGYDGKAIHRSTFFDIDSNEKRFSFISGDRDRSLARWYRIRRRYPGWRLVGPW